MTPRVLRALLVLLVVLQSAIAVADVHQFHQQNPMHLILAMGGSADTEEVNSAASQGDNAASIDQCTHCCHCHGTMSALSGHAPLLPVFDKAFSLSEHFFLNKSWLSSPDIRPPIV